jgi:hypothetical protein
LVQGGLLYSYECKAFQNPTLHQPAKRYCKAAWGTTRENIDSVWLAYFTDRQVPRF